MFKVKIYTIHKTKEKWLKEAIFEYEKRLKPFISLNFEILKNEKELEKKISKESFYICLDEKGKKLSSHAFSKKILYYFQKNHLNINFVIGSDKGISNKIKSNASFIFSLSDLTFTHQITRLLLIEQLYRAIQIANKSKYHK